MDIIQQIIQRGFLRAGVSLGIYGLSYQSSPDAKWQGFDIDIAKAVACAVLGNSEAVQYIPLASSERFRAIHDNFIDIGTFNATITMAREAKYNLAFTEPLLYDGEAFMIHRQDAAIKDPIRHLAKRKVAVLSGSTTYENLRFYFADLNLDFKVAEYSSPDAALRVYEDNECTIHCLDRILLSGEQQRLSRPEDHVILADKISSEAMSPVVNSQDPRWLKAVRWILKALIEAERLGITQANIHQKSEQGAAYIQKFLQPAEVLTEQLGLIPNFTKAVISAVGNYGEIFERNLGSNSRLKLNRGENRLIADGGLLFSPLFM